VARPGTGGEQPSDHGGRHRRDEWDDRAGPLHQEHHDHSQHDGDDNGARTAAQLGHQGYSFVLFSNCRLSMIEVTAAASKDFPVNAITAVDGSGHCPAMTQHPSFATPSSV